MSEAKQRMKKLSSAETPGNRLVPAGAYEGFCAGELFHPASHSASGAASAAMPL